MHQPSFRQSTGAQFRECVNKDILTHVRSLRYPLVLILTVAAALFVTVIRTHVYRMQVRDHAQASAEWGRTEASVRHTWQSIGLGLIFEKAPEPLSIFAFGLENEMTRSVSFGEFYPDRAGLRKLGATSFRYFGQIDITRIVFFGYSLLALLLVFDSITAPRERGTLRILLAGPIARSTVIFGKITAGLVTLAVPLGLAWGISVAYAMLFSGHVFSGNDLVRICGMVAVSFLYVATVFSIGIAASCWSASSNMSLVLVLFGWLLTVLVLPAGVKAACDLVYPVPSFAAIEQDDESIAAAFGDPTVLADAVKEVRRRQPGLDSAQVIHLAKELLAEKPRLAEQARENKMRDNVTLFDECLRISPAWSYLSAGTALAGTGATDYLRYLGALRMFRREFAAAADAQKQRSEKIGGVPWYQATVPYTPEMWPQFPFRRTPVRGLLTTLAKDSAWLFSGMVFFLLFAVFGFISRET